MCDVFSKIFDKSIQNAITDGDSENKHDYYRDGNMSYPEDMPILI